MKKLFICFLLITALFLPSCAHRHSYGEVKEKYAECTSEGYAYRICKTCKEVEYLETISAKRHNVESYINDIRFQVSYGYCAECGMKITDGVYVPPEGIDRLYVYGVPDGVLIPIEVMYSDNGTEYNIYGNISKDGNESNAYTKKDYDLVLFGDSERTEPIALNFDASLSVYDTYALKSEYADKSAVRNITASALWTAVISTRKSIDDNLKKLPSYGADSGFPMLLYTNNNYKGIYNLCKPNDEKLFGLTDPEKQVLIYSYPFLGSFDFRYLKNDSEYVMCQVIYPTENEQKLSASERFNQFAEFVLASDDDEFVSRIDDMLDVEAAIDYLLCVYVFGADANSENFCNWVSFDGKKWIPSMYNLTHSFGINEAGESVLASETLKPEFVDGVLVSGTNNALWEKLCRNYSDEICARYAKLRSSLLNAENIKAVFESFRLLISDEVYTSEFDEYPEKHYFTGAYDPQSIYEWSKEKIAILDEILLKK